MENDISGMSKEGFMHCEAPRQQEVDWDALWEQRAKEIRKKYREAHKEQIKEYQKEYWREYQRTHSEQRKKIVRKSQKKRRAEAREKGLCIQCCIGIPAPGRKSCPKCLERARAYSRKKFEEKKGISSI